MAKCGIEKDSSKIYQKVHVSRATSFVDAHGIAIVDSALDDELKYKRGDLFVRHNWEANITQDCFRSSRNISLEQMLNTPLNEAIANFTLIQWIYVGSKTSDYEIKSTLPVISLRTFETGIIATGACLLASKDPRVQ